MFVFFICEIKYLLKMSSHKVTKLWILHNKRTNKKNFETVYVYVQKILFFTQNIHTNRHTFLASTNMKEEIKMHDTKC